jgi:periplasmic copper chaperone A
VAIGIAVVWLLGGGAGVAAADPSITVSDAWTLALPGVVTSAEIYMVIENRGTTADRLIGAASLACASIEPYESVGGMAGRPARPGMPTMRGMRPVPGGAIDVPTGRLTLEPGGLHLMCMGRRVGLRSGATVPLRLRFRDAGEVAVELEVRE